MWQQGCKKVVSDFLPIEIGEKGQAIEVGVALLLSILSFACLCGCVGPKADFNSSNVRVNTGATYLDSAAIQASGQRIAQKQERIDHQQNCHERVSWGGVAVFGVGQEGVDLPICSKLKGEFQAALVSRLNHLVPANFELKNLGAGASDNLAAGDGLVMVLALVAESASQDHVLEGQLRGQMSVFGQLMFLDAQRGNQLVASYPVGIVESDLYDSPPSDVQFAELAKLGLWGAQRHADGLPVSLCDQVEDLLVKNAVAPRAVFAPIEVGQIRFGPACRAAVTPQGMVPITEDQIAKWSDEMACRFAGYLGTGSGLPVNPYLPGGSLQLDKNRVTSYATRSFAIRRGDDSLIQAHLPAPRLLLDLEITSLHAILDPKKSDLFSKKVDYGMSGKLVVINADSQRVVSEWPLEWPELSAKGLPSQLREKYASLVEATFTTDEFNTSINHVTIWGKKLDRMANQLAREIAFPEEDLANRFGELRSKIRLNALLNLEPSPFTFASNP